ncbi:MAG: zinc-dependent metalloprotease [Actinomycetota bacterium]
MSSSDFSGGDMPFFDLRNLFGAAGGDPWANAGELAAAIASEGGSETNLDPLVRMAVEDLVRVAELHIAQATGITLPSNTKVTPVTRREWTTSSIDTFRPFFERFGEAVGTAMQVEGSEGADPLGAMLSQLFASMGPMLVSVSAGSMIGHLGQTALGQYDLPIPRDSAEVLVVPASIDAAAADWDVPVADLRLWVLLHELAAHAVLSVPHVKRRMESLLLDFAAAFHPNPEAIAEQFSGMGQLTDLSQLAEMSEQLNDPDLLLNMMRSPAHDLLVPQFDALVASIIGFVGYTVAETGRPLIGSIDVIREQFRQRWLDVTPADRFMERLLGLEITAETLARGDRFIDGIVTRAGDEGLARLWADELDLPTAAEVDAPGLWLARIGLDADVGQVSAEVPDDLSGLDEL